MQASTTGRWLHHDLKNSPDFESYGSVPRHGLVWLMLKPKGQLYVLSNDKSLSSRSRISKVGVVGPESAIVFQKFERESLDSRQVWGAII